MVSLSFSLWWIGRWRVGWPIGDCVADPKSSLLSPFFACISPLSLSSLVHPSSPLTLSPLRHTVHLFSNISNINIKSNRSGKYKTITSLLCSLRLCLSLLSFVQSISAWPPPERCPRSVRGVRSVHVQEKTYMHSMRVVDHAPPTHQCPFLYTTPTITSSPPRPIPPTLYAVWREDGGGGR